MLTYVNRFGRTILATDVVISNNIKSMGRAVLLFPFVSLVFPYPHLLWSKQWIQINGSQ